MYGPFTNEVLLGRGLEGRRDEVVIATKFGNVRDADGRPSARINGRPEYVRPAATRRCSGSGSTHRPLLPAPGRSRHADRGDRRGHGRARGGGQGALPRPVRGGAGHHPPRPCGASDLGAADRVLAVDPRPRGRDPPTLPRARDRLRPLQPARARLSHRHPAHARRSWRRTTSADISPAFTGQSRGQHRHRRADRRAGLRTKGCTPAQIALAWVHAQGRDLVPIPGTKRRRYLEENIGALESN